MEETRKAAFCHVGEHYIAFKVMAKEIGFEVIDLPKPNRDSVHKGVSITPEFSCFPFKVFTGSYIQALDMGADLLITQTNNKITGCQYSDFAYAQKRMLQKKGYNFDMIIIEGFHPRTVYSELKKYKKDMTLKKAAEILIILSQKIYLIDDLDKYYFEVYRSVGKREAEDFRKRWLKVIDETDTIINLYSLGSKMKEDYGKYPKKPIGLKVAVVGDIYTINDDYINNNIFERLLDQGVSVERGHRLSDLITSRLGFSNMKSSTIKKAKSYLKHNVGGLSQSTLASAINFAEQKYDGIIQVYPFNCMPETVVRTILPKISQDYNIPILFLPVDEQTGDAGFQTRVDAFVDLITIRKEKGAKSEK